VADILLDHRCPACVVARVPQPAFDSRRDLSPPRIATPAPRFSKPSTAPLDRAFGYPPDRTSKSYHAASAEIEMTAENVIDVKRLRYFIAVCKHGGFSHAAGIIGVAQPALTRQVQLLERELGLKLIARNGRGATPTEEGRFLLARSSEYLEGLDNLLVELKERFSRIKGQAVIGICPTISPFFLDDLKSHVAANGPDFSLSVVEAYSGDLKSLMNSGRLDLALTYKPSTNLGGNHVELFSEQLVLVSEFQLDVPQRAYQLSELERLKLILPSRIHELRLIIDSVCRRRGVLLRPDLELDSLDVVKAFLKRPLRLYTILPAFSVQNEVQGRQFSQYVIDDPDMIRTISIVTPPKPRNEAATEYLQRHIEKRASAIRSRLTTVF
jgi:DNA-binding transcriptional LysR family regulator